MCSWIDQVSPSRRIKSRGRSRTLSSILGAVLLRRSTAYGKIPTGRSKWTVRAVRAPCFVVLQNCSATDLL